jgi:hypothetical protein
MVAAATRCVALSSQGSQPDSLVLAVRVRAPHRGSDRTAATAQVLRVVSVAAADVRVRVRDRDSHAVRVHRGANAAVR